MALATGTRLGDDYEIIAPLGAGGMGEVYRARDTKLGREVAIKLVLPEVSADPERRARFEREARVLASLNHPNIATLYGHFSHGDTGFLVMELVGGETLAERIKRGPIPLSEAIPIFVEIAEGVGAAHESGVLHRDLKPANIKIVGEDGSGAVKILDFGLAKAVAEDPATTDPTLSASPTLTLAATQRGEILGTAAYMAPEQARGRPVDRRADVWAFACCLFEALTGKRPFEGEDASVTLARVIEGTPDWEALPNDLPWLLRRLLERCLAKDPRERLHDIGDVRLELVSAFDSAPGREETSAPSQALGSSALWGAVGFVLGALVLWGAGTLWLRPEALQPLTVIRTTISPGPGNTLGFPRGPMLAISDDASSLAFIGRRDGIEQIYLRRFDELDPVALAGTGNHSDLFFSPRGDWLAFEGDGSLQKRDLVGGASIEVQAQALVRGGNWSSDEFLVWGRIGAGLYRRQSSGDGEPEVLTSPPEGTVHELPEVLPSGNAVLFTKITIGDEVRIAVLDLDDDSITVLLQGSGPRYARSGHLVFGREDGLWAVPFDPQRLEILATPSRVVSDASVIPPHYPQFDIADDGTLAYVRGADAIGSRILIRVDPSGVEEVLPVTGTMVGNPAVSPDGSKIAAANTDEQGTNLWIFDTVRGTLSQITFTNGVNAYPSWAPGGGQIAFWTDRDGGSFWTVNPDGIGEPQRLFESRAPFAQNTTWSPDGSHFLYLEFVGGSRATALVRLSLDTGETQHLLESRPGLFQPMISPDGRWLAYSSLETGTSEIFVRPYPDVEAGKWRISIDGGESPLWSRDSSQLFFVSRDFMTVVDIEGSVVFSVGQPRRLFEVSDSVRGTTPGSRRTYDVTPDGRFVMSRGPRGSAVGDEEIVIVQNFHEVLRRLAPAE